MSWLGDPAVREALGWLALVFVGGLVFSCVWAVVSIWHTRNHPRELTSEERYALNAEGLRIRHERQSK
jgi:hypothetical protein